MKRKPNFKKEREPREGGRRKYPGEELLNDQGMYSSRDDGKKGRGYRVNKRDWPRMLLHAMPVQYTGLTKKELKKLRKV